MNLLKTIIFIGLTMILVNCGNSQNNNKGANTVRVAAVEDGVPKTEDGRIILSSQSEDNPLVMPEGTCKYCVVSPQKLGEEIASQLKSVSEVYNISFSSELYATEVLLDILSLGLANEGYNYFSVSFTINTITPRTHNIKCQAETDSLRLILKNCGNDLVSLPEYISLNFYKFVIDDSNSPRYLNSDYSD